MILKAQAFPQRYPLPPDFVAAPSHGAVFFLLPLSFSVILDISNRGSSVFVFCSCSGAISCRCFSLSPLRERAGVRGKLLWPSPFVFVPAADAANGKRHEMAPLHKRGKSYPRDPIAPPHGACGRGYAPVPNPIWGRGLSERSEFRSPNNRDRGKGTRRATPGRPWFWVLLPKQKDLGARGRNPAKPSPSACGAETPQTPRPPLHYELQA